MSLLAYRFVLPVLISVISVGCGWDPTVEDVREVYRTILTEEALAAPQFVMLSKKADPTDTLASGPEHLQLLQQYEFPAAGQMFAEEDFPGVNVAVISEAQRNSLFSEGCESGWRKFHWKYPEAGRLIGLSNVGFRNAGKEALVYLEIGSGCLAGAGKLLLLSLSENGWKIKGESVLWVS